MERIVLSIAVPDQALAAASGLTWFAVTEQTAEVRSRAVPARCKLLHLRVQLKTIAGGATALTAQLARSDDGSGQLSNRSLSAAGQALSFERTGGTTSTTRAAAMWPLDEVPYVRRTGDTAGTLYVGLLLDAGTAVVEELELITEQWGAA